MSKINVKQFIVACIVIFIFIIMSYAFNYSLLSENLQKYEQGVFSRVQTKIQDWTLSNFRNVGNMAEILQNYDVEDQSEFNNILFKLQKTSNFPYLILGLEDGTFYISDQNFILPHHYTPTTRDWFIDTTKAQKTIATKPYFSMRLGLRSVSICTPIVILNKHGVFCGGQPFEFIRNYFSEYKVLYDKNLFLVDNSGEVLGKIRETTNDKINLKDQNLVVFPIKNTNWSIVFEKNREIYTTIMGKFLIMNFGFYIVFIIIFFITNIFWYSQNRKTSMDIAKQSNLIKDILVKRKDSVLIITNKEFEIINSDIENFFDLSLGGNFLINIENSKCLDPELKDEFKEKLLLTLQTQSCEYMNAKIKTTNFLISFGFLIAKDEITITILFQDIDYLSETISQNSDMQMDKILLFIRKNIDDEDLCIDKLSKISGYSKFHFQRMFKNYVGKSLVAYLRELRLERAIFFLKFSQMKIQDIAINCGFKHTETFNRAFIKHYDITPGKCKYDNIKNSVNLVYEEVILDDLNLKISFSEPQDSNEQIYYITDNIFLKFYYGMMVKENEVINVKFKRDKYIKVNFKLTNSSLAKTIEKMYLVFYDETIYNSEIPIVFYTKNSLQQIDFIYIKI